MGAAYSTYCGTELRDTQYAGECRLVDGTTDPTPGGSRSLAASGIDATGASAVLNIGHWFTFAGTVLSHGAGSNNFTYERDSGGGGWKAAKYNPHADLYFLEGLLSLLDGPTEWHYERGARTIDRLTLAQVGVVRRGQDAPAVAAQQPLEVPVVDVGKEHAATRAHRVRRRA